MKMLKKLPDKMLDKFVKMPPERALGCLVRKYWFDMSFDAGMLVMILESTKEKIEKCVLEKWIIDAHHSRDGSHVVLV